MKNDKKHCNAFAMPASAGLSCGARGVMSAADATLAPFMSGAQPFTPPMSSGMSAASMGLLARSCSRGGMLLEGGKRATAMVMLACAVQMAVAPAAMAADRVDVTSASPFTNYTVGKNVSMYVSNGGVATSTTINSGGKQHVSNGGTATSTTINYGGSQYVEGTANDTTINGGWQNVSSGGTATGTTINGGRQYVSSGGTATSTTIINGGRQYVSSGGTATSTTINNGGQQFISAGGTATGTTINDGGQQVIYASGTTTDVTMNGGTLAISGGGKTSGTLQGHGTVDVASAYTIGGTDSFNNVKVSGGVLSIGQNTTSGVQKKAVTVANGGVLTLGSGGSLDAASVTINSGGEQHVSNGGTATGTTINSNGVQYVESGGTATGTTISSGGTQRVSNGGIATSTTINYGGWQNVYDGGMATSTTINGNGVQWIYDGGTASGTTINNGGHQYIESGGTATGTTINGGTQRVSNGGIATSTTINYGGTQYVHGGGTATNTTINSGGYQLVSSTVSDTTINSGGYQYVYNSGTTTDVTLGGGTLAFDAGGKASGTLQGHGTFQAVSDYTIGGADSFKTVNVSGGALSIGHAVFVANGGVLTLGNGGSLDAASVTINAGGLQNVSSGGTASGIVITTSGSQTIYAGGSALNTSMHGGLQTVQAGGTATSTQVGIFAEQHVHGIADKTVLAGEQHIYTGGTATDTYINGGTQNVSNGGTASGTTISAFGMQNINDGGTATDTTIYNDGEQHVSSGGTATGTTINSGGQQHVSSGGIATSTTISSDGRQYVYSGTATGTTINDGGIQHVHNGGIATSTTISGGSQYVEGIATSTTINNGGNQYVSSGGTATSTTILGGQQQVVGTAINTTINGGQQLIASSGTATGTTINDGIQGIYAGGKAEGTVIGVGHQYVVGGSASDTILNGGLQLISENGIASDTTINSGGIQELVSGTAWNTTINSGGAQKVGGTATGTTINDGGKMEIFADGLGSGATVNSGGLLAVNNKGTAEDVTLNGGMLLAEGTVAGNLVINSGMATLGGLDPTFIQEAITESGKSAGLYVAKPMDLSGQSITVGSDAEALGSDGISLGSDAVLDINIDSATSSEPVLRTKKLIIAPDAVLSLTGISHANEYNAYDAEVTGSFSKVLSDHIGFKAVIDPTTGMVKLRPDSVAEELPTLDRNLITLIDNASEAGELGTDDKHLFSQEGGVRFLSRVVSKEFGASNLQHDAVDIESVSRIAVVGAVPQLTSAISDAASRAVAGRLDASSHADTQLAASGEKGEGVAVWAMPLYQKVKGNGLKGGNYELDGHGWVGGMALGADYTFANAVRAGVMINAGAGEAEDGGDFDRTTNDVTFWGLGAYVGWNLADFNLSADVQYTHTRNEIGQFMPTEMQMADLSTNIHAKALSAGLHAEYKFSAKWMDIVPHLGVRFTHLMIPNYAVKSGGLTVMEGANMYQNVWSFPVGVTFTKDFALENGWAIKPLLDLRVTPKAGDIDARARVSFTGVPGSAITETQTMDDLTYGSTLGLEFSKGNMKLDFAYSVDAGKDVSSHGFFARWSWKF